MPEEKKDSTKTTTKSVNNDSFTDEKGNVWPNPVQDIDPNQLEFGDWFKSEMRNNPGGVGTYKGKQYKLEHKEFGGSVKGIGNWNHNIPGMINGRHK